MHLGNLYMYFFSLFMLTFVDSLKFLLKERYNSSLQVVTSTGIVQGEERRTDQNVSYFSYEGIPYAEPPLGNLRFRAPIRLKSWKGVLNASIPGSECIQNSLRYIYIKRLGAEDCLYLNVYTPINLKLNKKQVPVIFWIHGGAYFEGSGSYYTSDNLINNGLIVVTINYRLGALGFLNTEDANSPGNYGLKDQNAALRWTHENIPRFGGDPLKITISGQSAGGCSVMYHLISPKSKGLFSRAIVWSGESTSSWSYQKNPKIIAMDLATDLGINVQNVTEMIESLRKANIDDLMSAQLNVFLIHSIDIFHEGIFFTPTIEYEHDNAFVTEGVLDAIKMKRFVDPVPVMIGITTMEAGLFEFVFNLLRPLLNTLFNASPSFIPNGKSNIPFLKSRRIGLKILEKYFKSKSLLISTSEDFISYFTDLIFTKPIMDTLRTLSLVTPVYFFVSGYSEPLTKMLLEKIEGLPINTTIPGPVHVEDVLLIWNYKHSTLPSKRRSLGETFSKMWFNFATTGNPTPTTNILLNNITWPSVSDINNIPYLWLDDDPRIAYNFKKEIVDFWDGLTTL